MGGENDQMWLLKQNPLRTTHLIFHCFSYCFMQNNVNAESSSSVQMGPGDRQSRVAHIPASQPWSQSHGTGGSLQRDGPGAFLLDLQNFPDLSKADINGQNPNIQVGRS